jgi:hypothetical protein
MSNQVYFQTKSDSTGLVIIKPKDLPIFEYYLEAEIPGTEQEVIAKKTDEFIMDNKSYLEKNNINLITATRNGINITE